MIFIMCVQTGEENGKLVKTYQVSVAEFVGKYLRYVDGPGAFLTGEDGKN